MSAIAVKTSRTRSIRLRSLWNDILSTDAYISPGWYPSKHETGRQVPTWNYIVVHAHGHATVRDDELYVRGMVARLTRSHEAAQSKPWRMTDGPKDYIDMMLQNIVGIEIEITRLSGKWKLGQNKEASDIRGAVEGPGNQGETVNSDAMLTGIRTR
ncbi:FMN-binding negative transcriptional regulator [Rhizobium sp. NFACC06-2]|uniref:FMN-binding negative transcriptional regulator n=1 Tax=Rhizobium sp. NFACC06-2 TaxID=1566264 RepID=UPI000876BCD1|nr:FMN-binding negative transcriptional regulator [Rhizobium sp. NFACC06-2]SCY91598.1 negative transcriptional regulator, PaiB family [Rhizobium sp. NFACC06-2]